jgi:hypothetical protein
MLSNFVKRRTTLLDDEIHRIRTEMLEVDVYSEEYTTLLATFERLIRLQDANRSNRVSPDTMAIVCANILGILIIVGYEQGHVVASRGLQFLLRTKNQ